MKYFEEPSKQIPIREFDVVIAGGGTAGVVAAIAAARQGAKTVLIESKGYVGGTVIEGGTALHSFFNLWKAFPGVEKRQIVKGIPAEIIDRLEKIGGTCGHAEAGINYDYDSMCTAIDVEMYKLVVFEMLREAGVTVFVNTLLAEAVMEDTADSDKGNKEMKGAIIESRSGREMLSAKIFVDCTGYGDLSAYAGAEFTEPNDHQVANSIGVGGVSIEKLYEYFSGFDAVKECVEGRRSGECNKIIRLDADMDKLPPELAEEAKKIGMSFVTTSVHDDYLMFIKINYTLDGSPTNRDKVALAELELRKRQARALNLIRKHIPGAGKAFIARTSPGLSIRRGRCIVCDYDMPLNDILEGRHYGDDVMSYGFHDMAPMLQIKGGGTYGIPYRALRVAGINNLLAAGMLITSEWKAHMSTRNTVSCMAQGQAAGTAAALCASGNFGTRELPYPLLNEALVKGGVYLEVG